MTRTASNWKSALSTGLSLSLLLRTHDPLLWIAASVLAMGSKYLLRVNGKHLFNPSALAIVVLLLATDKAWCRPDNGARGCGCGPDGVDGMPDPDARGTAGRRDNLPRRHAALLLFRAWSLGDPLEIPLQAQMQSGALLIFGLFMLTDPRSTPDSRTGRLLFGMAVALVAHLLLFRYQIRERACRST